MEVVHRKADPSDTLHDHSRPSEHWSTSNVRENVPGVPTPLTWSMWRTTSEHSVRRAAHAIGVLTDDELALPASYDDYWSRIFYGRYALQVEYLALVGDRMPGTTGPEAVKSLLGRVPEDIDYQPTKARYGAIAWRLPRTFFTMPRTCRDTAAATDAWYARQLPRVASLDTAGATALLLEAMDKHIEVVVVQTTSVFSMVQPLYDALGRLVDKVGVGDVGVLSGFGGAEVTGMVGDLWQASRGQLTIEEVARRHGFHGAYEGELSARVWREDPGQLARRLQDYAARPDADDPRRAEAVQERRRIEVVREVLAAVPAAQRPGVRLLLHLAATRIPLRGVVKRAMLQATDVARAAARRLGECLVEDGRLDDPEDVFYLTREELAGPWPADARELVTRRRERRAEYEQLELPADWTGMPEPAAADSGDDEGDLLTGIGVSPGVVEGVARVVHDPAVEDIEPDEILVAPTTNPSWSSVMFTSSGLVVDIGGALSHAAVVARELGLPCVVNTRVGSRAIHSGDRLRVDGASGTVEILERAAVAS